MPAGYTADEVKAELDLAVERMSERIEKLERAQGEIFDHLHKLDPSYDYETGRDGECDED